MPDSLRSLLIALAVIIASQLAIAAQQPLASSGSKERELGIAQYQKRDYQGAIKSLSDVVEENETDLESWHYLGLSFEQAGQTGDARKAHAKAAKLGDQLLDSLFQKLARRFDVKVVHEAETLVAMAASSTQKYIALSGTLSPSKQEEWNDRAENFHTFKEWSSEEPRLFSGKQVITKARVLSKPEPIYTQEARRNQVMGTILLSCVFCADGKVRVIRAIRGLPDGLTENAIQVAKLIRFVPATRDGKPVAMLMHLEYNFNLN